MKYNYHTHTTRCQHAIGSDEQYVQAAINGGFRVLGFSDHIPLPFESKIRMHMDELPDYLASVASLKSKYEGQIVIHTGFESEWFPQYKDYYHSLFDQGVEYLLLGQHYLDSSDEHLSAPSKCVKDEKIMRYVDTVVDGLQSGFFSYLAHPDLYMKYRPEDAFNKTCEQAADIICQAALEANVPLEFNLLGQLEGVGYPCNAFWEYAKKWNTPVIIGVDAHSPFDLLNQRNIERGHQRVLEYGYTLVDHLPMDD